MISMFDKAYALLFKLGNLSQIVLLLFFRLNWGWQFFVSGKGKLLNHGDIVDFFASLHLPFADFYRLVCGWCGSCRRHFTSAWIGCQTGGFASRRQYDCCLSGSG